MKVPIDFINNECFEFPLTAGPELVRAILSGSKTQIIRAMSPSEMRDCELVNAASDLPHNEILRDDIVMRLVSRFAVGDRFWIQEPWRDDDGNNCSRQTMPRSMSKLALRITDIRIISASCMTEQDARLAGVEPRTTTNLSNADVPEPWSIKSDTNTSYRAGFIHRWRDTNHWGETNSRHYKWNQYMDFWAYSVSLEFPKPPPEADEVLVGSKVFVKNPESYHYRSTGQVVGVKSYYETSILLDGWSHLIRFRQSGQNGLAVKWWEGPL